MKISIERGTFLDALSASVLGSPFLGYKGTALRAAKAQEQGLKVMTAAEAAAWQCAHDMARALPVCGTLLAQHLGDEEDLVIPLLALREAAPRAA